MTVDADSMVLRRGLVGIPDELQPFERGALLMTPAGVETFIAMNQSNLAVTTVKRERRVEVSVWRVDEVREV